MEMAEDNPFAEPSPGRNFALKVEGELFWISIDTLTGYSPIFKKMIYGDFEMPDEMVLLNKRAEDILELLRCICPMPRTKDIDLDNIDLLLQFADEYVMHELVRRAETFLRLAMAKCPSGDEKLLRILRVGSRGIFRTSLKQCILRCAREFTYEQLEPLYGQGLPREVYACLMIGGRRCRYVDCHCEYVEGPWRNPCAPCNNIHVNPAGPRPKRQCKYCKLFLCPDCTGNNICANVEKTIDMILAQSFDYH